MKKLTLATIAFSFAAASTVFAGNLYTQKVLGWDNNGDAIYGTINGTVKTHKVTGWDNNGDAVYGAVHGAVKTQKVIGFDDDINPIYANDADYASKAKETANN